VLAGGIRCWRAGLGAVGHRGVMGGHRWILRSCKRRRWTQGIDGLWVGIHAFHVIVRDSGGWDWAWWGADGS